MSEKPLLNPDLVKQLKGKFDRADNLKQLCNALNQMQIYLQRTSDWPIDNYCEIYQYYFGVDLSNLLKFNVQAPKCGDDIFSWNSKYYLMISQEPEQKWELVERKKWDMQFEIVEDYR